MSRNLSSPKFVLALMGLVTASACQDLADPLTNTPTTDDSTEIVQFVDEMGVQAATDAMVSRSARVEVQLVEGDDLVAGEVRIEWPNVRTDDEVLRSSITAMDDESGTITLALGGLVVDYSQAEQFLETHESELTREEFEALVLQALEDEQPPGVHIQRPAPESPQAPDDMTFQATSLRLDEVETEVLELDIDRDNLSRNDNPPPDGWLTVLGLAIELRVSEGITEIRVERPQLEVRRFDGAVTGVDLDARSFTLDDGTVVELSDRTRVKPYFWAGHRRLATLESVQEALDAGLTVRARGRGVVKTEDPPTLVAIHVRFRLDRVELEAFGGEVAAVDVEAATITLADETTVKLIGHTVILVEDGHEKTRSLEAVAGALEAGREVRVKGLGFTADGADDTIFAVFAWFRISDANVTEFAGTVTSVDIEAQSFVIDEELTVFVTDDTEIRNDGHDQQVLDNLDAVQEALEAELDVTARGTGTPVEDADPPAITALTVRFAVELPDLVQFEGVITSVDVEAAEFTLDDGTIVRLSDVTYTNALNDGQDIVTLDIIARTVQAGIVVRASGTGILIDEDPRTIQAVTVEFRVELDTNEFEGSVTAVDVDARTVTLDDETVIQLVAGTRVVFGEGLESLEDVAAAVADDGTVVARAKGLVTGNDPLTVIALWITFAIQ